MARQLEERYYWSIPTKEEYMSLTTLKKWIQAHLCSLSDQTKGDSKTVKKRSRKHSKISSNNDSKLGGESTSLEGKQNIKSEEMESEFSISSQQLYNHSNNSKEDKHTLNNNLSAHQTRDKPSNGSQQRSDTDGINQSIQTQLYRSNQQDVPTINQIVPPKVEQIHPNQPLNSSVSKVAVKKKVVRQQQQRLLLLRHASKCTAGPSCKTKFCCQMVTLWKHMKKCRKIDCKTSHCLSSRCVLNHYRICKSKNKTSSCEVCAPVMKHIRAQTLINKVGKNPGSSINQLKETSDAQAASGVTKVSNPISNEFNGNSMTNSSTIESCDVREVYNRHNLMLQELKEQMSGLVNQKVLTQSQEGQEFQHQQHLLKGLHQQFEQQQMNLQRELQRQVQVMEQRQHRNMTGEKSEPINELNKQSDLSLMNEKAQSLEKMDNSTTFILDNEKEKKKKTKRRNSRPKSETSTRLKVKKDNKGIKRAVDDVLTDGGVETGMTLSPSSSSGEKRIRKVENSNSSEVSSVNATNAVSKSKNNHEFSEEIKEKPENDTTLISSMSNQAIQDHLGSLKSCPNATSRRTSQICLPFLKKLLNDPCSWVFKDPVDPIELGLPDYLDVIKTPMDLTLIGKKLESGDYNEIETFGQEIRLVFDNAIVYNGECSDVGAMAKKLLNMFDKAFSEIGKGQLS